jgi:hypothetical protein
MAIWRPFYIRCSCCGHKNRPHKSPDVGIRLALTGQAGNCKGCGKKLNPQLSDRPLTRRIRLELSAQGISTVC